MQHDLAEVCVMRDGGVEEKEEWKGRGHLNSSYPYRVQPVLYIVLGPSWWLVTQELGGRGRGSITAREPRLLAILCDMLLIPYDRPMHLEHLPSYVDKGAGVERLPNLSSRGGL